MHSCTTSTSLSSEGKILAIGAKKRRDEESDQVFLYSYHDNQPSAIRKNAWKMHVRIGSQTGNNYGFEASREKPLLFQVEKDLGEKVNVSENHPEKIIELKTSLETIEQQIKNEGSFWGTNNDL